MAAGSSSQQNFRKAIGAIKDSTSVGIAKVNSEYKELNVSILKATNHVEVLPKEKHVRIILGAVSGSRPRADVSYCIHTLTRRLAKTRTWVVALKTLIVIHRALREVDHSFCEELIYHNKSRGQLLNLLHFKDDSSPSAWDYSTWIRAYALYIEECLECFRVLKYDFHRDHSENEEVRYSCLARALARFATTSFSPPWLRASWSSPVAAESVRLYVAITDGVLILVDKFFEMQRRDAVRALEIYRKSAEQAQRLSEFFEICRGLDFGRRQKYVKIEQPPASFLTAMEEYIKDAPQPLMLPWTDNDDCVTPKLIAVPDENLETDPSADPHETTKTDKSDTDATPLIPDLLSWDEPSQEASELDENNSIPPSITTPGSEFSSEPAGWELALVTTIPDATSVAISKGGVLDRSILDSLYDAALTTPNTNGATYQISNVSSNPFETDGYNQDMFYDPTLVAQQPGFIMQVADQNPQQHAIALYSQQQNLQQRQQPVIGYEYMQMVGITQQQPAFIEQRPPFIEQQPAFIEQQHPQLQQQESSLIGHDLMQMTEMPLHEASMQQQEKPIADHGSVSTSGNPFAYELSSLPGAPQSQQSSNLSFI